MSQINNIQKKKPILQFDYQIHVVYFYLLFKMYNHNNFVGIFLVEIIEFHAMQSL
jgi:hypothetical protein